MRPEDEVYFENIESELDAAVAVANEAKSRGDDPRPHVEIPVAKDMADRVENILGIDGVAERVRELEGDVSREEAALALVEDFVEGTVGDFDTDAATIEGAVRTAVALLTEGVVAAPIEGIDRVEIETNDDGTKYIAVYYAGPIRSAGGTAQALSVLAADYARSLLGIDEFKPRDREVKRYAEEVALYDRETGLQYSPSDAETEYIATNTPIRLDGEATGQEEVSGYRDLERVDTNSPRGGMCLVLAEGIALKAPKIQRYTRDLDAVDWPWLQDLIDGTITAESNDSVADADDVPVPDDHDDSEDEREGPPRVEPSGKYLRDLIAGRPVFGHPSAEGGFRLRYGRARNHGFATAGVHPATMHLVDDFLAPGTQIKTERPGKAAGVVPVDSIEGPTVKLANGDVRRVDDPAEALEIRNGVEAILDLGEYLVNYGEFVENNHPLAPASYTVDWWEGDLAAAGANVQALRDSPYVDLASPDPEQALNWALDHDAPLHPAYTYLWHDLDVDRFDALADAVASGTVDDGRLYVPRSEPVREALEVLLVEHAQEDETLVVSDWRPLVRTLGVTTDLEREWKREDLSEEARAWENAMKAVREVAPFDVRERAPTRIGNRMGRPEKSESRDLSPAVHTLFPIGDAGGDQRNVGDAATHTAEMNDRPGHLTVDVGVRECRDCGEHTYEPRCAECGGRTDPYYECPECGRAVEPDESGRVECPRCERTVDAVRSQTVDLNGAYHDALKAVGERENAFEILKGVKGLSSAEKVPEPLEKGILRAKHGVTTFKDGTVRYDMTDLPVTAVRPAELDVTVGQLRELGYETDIHGDPLEHPDQLVELRVQDVVLSDGAAEHMLKTADFVDDLLAEYYGLEPYYEVDERDDLVGELVFGMAPHTSAAVVGRVVGFTSAAVGYAHPYFHASKRRNCFVPETNVWIRDEDGDWHHERIEEIVEDRLEDPWTDDLGTLVEELDESIYVPSLKADGTPTIEPVSAVSKHIATDHLIEIETRSGRSLTVTPDHSMRKWEDGVCELEAHQVEEGDVIPRPTSSFAHAVAIDGRFAEFVGDMNSPALGNEQAGEMPGNREVASDGGDVWLDEVVSVNVVESDVDYTYSLTVENTHTLLANDLFVGQCDGDEDCVMLLMDGLLNFSKAYLPDKRGGSVAEDSRLVAIDPNGSLRFMTFEEFWNELEGPVERDGKFRKKTCLTEGWQTYSFNDSHESSIQPIEKAIRYRADESESLVKVHTQFGRSLELTEHHSLFRYDDGIEEVAGAALEAGDLVVAPRQLTVEPIETIIDTTDAVETPYVFIDDEVEGYLRDVWESADRGDETRAVFDSGLSYRLRKSKISFGTLSTVADRVGSSPPDEITVGLKGSSVGIDRFVSVDEDFAWLLGMFVAEGSLSGSNPTIHNSEEDLVDRVVEKTHSSLGTEPSIRWSNKAYEVAFPAVFREVLYYLGFEDADSYDSREKIVPPAILRAPDPVALAFLRGFIAADGSHSADGNVTTVGFHTTSEAVKDGVVFLLHRFGLVANVSYRERDDSRQPIFTVSVSGGASDNPLERILDGDEPYRPKSLTVTVPEALMELRQMDIPDIKQRIPKYLKRRDNISLEKLQEIVDDLSGDELPDAATTLLDDIRPLVDGDLSYLRVTDVETIDYDGYLYDLQVGGEPVFVANWLFAHNSMDAPLVMSSRIDPAEIDDEAHNMDVVEQYPREFYEATREMAPPESVDLTLAGDSVGTDSEYAGFRFTHDTTDIAMGPDLSAYKTLGSMMDKMDAQLELARKLRAVDETDVAERVIEYHFLPDLIGNLRAFSQQETRCLSCGRKYRRVPLSGNCRECGEDVNLTVHEGSVTKYLDTALEVAEEYGAREYTKQRLKILERSIESIFENDKNKQSGIADFM